MLILIDLIFIALFNLNKEIITETTEDRKDEDIYIQNIARYDLNSYICIFLKFFVTLIKICNLKTH